MILYLIQKNNYEKRTQIFEKNEGGFVLVGIKVGLVKIYYLHNKEINKT